MDSLENVLEILKSIHQEANDNIPKDTKDAWDLGWKACIDSIWIQLNE